MKIASEYFKINYNNKSKYKTILQITNILVNQIRIKQIRCPIIISIIYHWEWIIMKINNHLRIFNQQQQLLNNLNLH